MSKVFIVINSSSTSFKFISCSKSSSLNLFPSSAKTTFLVPGPGICRDGGRGRGRGGGRGGGRGRGRGRLVTSSSS